MERERLKYQDLIAMMPKLIQVTPELAEEWLSRNYENNRRVSKITVEKYKADLINGNWRDANPNAPISFNTNGDLIDGQHRLLAVKESNIATYFYVSENVPLDYFDIFDNGRKRKAADQIEGPYRQQRTALANKVLSVENGKTISSALRCAENKITQQDIIDKVRQDPLILDCVKKANEIAPKAFGTSYIHIVAFFIYIITVYGDKTYLEGYLEELKNPTTIYTSVAIPKNKILQKILPKGRIEQEWILNMLFFSYNAFTNGKDIHAIKQMDIWCSKYTEIIRERNKTQNNRKDIKNEKN